MQWANFLANGGVYLGRRILSENGRDDLKLIAKICRRAKAGQPPETKMRWGQLRCALVRVYAELGGN